MSEEKTALLPCPFCGGDAEINDRPYYHAWCSTDTCPTDSLYDTKEDAIKAWNQRPSDRSGELSDDIDPKFIPLLIARGWTPPLSNEEG